MKKTILTTFIFGLACANSVYAHSFMPHELFKSRKVIDKHTLPMMTIHLNEATLKTLTRLKGIGKKRAKNIIAYRDSHGAFQTINDLVKVSGFNKKFIEKLIEKNKNTKILI
jgi:comEA protein